MIRFRILVNIYFQYHKLAFAIKKSLNEEIFQSHANKEKQDYLQYLSSLMVACQNKMQQKGKSLQK